MVGVLTESFTRSRRPPLSKILFQTQEKKYREDIEELEAVAKELLNDRRANPRSKKDLLNAMILNKDPKTGESLDNDTIIRNMIIFLIAGMNILPATPKSTLPMRSKATRLRRAYFRSSFMSFGKT